VLEWMDEAACLGADDLLTLPLGAKRAEAEVRAKALCASCSVREQCLEWARRFDPKDFKDLVIAGHTYEELVELLSSKS